MMYLYDGAPANNPEDIKYINRLLQQLKYNYYNLHKNVTHYDYQYDTCHVSEDWTVMASRKVIKDRIKEDILNPDYWSVTIELLKDQTVCIVIEVDPADYIEYTITTLNKEQWLKLHFDIYGGEEEDYVEVFE